MQRCFEFVVHVDHMTIFGDEDEHCLLLKKKLERSTRDALRLKERRLV